MDCDRLKRLIKTWYAQVQDETMAPARMISFMRQHVADCETCLGDPFVRPEIDKITAIILPPDKPRSSAGDESDKAGDTAKKKEAEAPAEDAEAEEADVEGDVEGDE